MGEFTLNIQNEFKLEKEFEMSLSNKDGVIGSE